MPKRAPFVAAFLATGIIAYGCATGVDNQPTGDDDDGGGGQGGTGAEGGATSTGGGASVSSSSSSSSSASASVSSSSGGVVCGNGMCEPGESCQTCPSDCGSCCGNGVCDANESCATCPNDCFANCCGDGVCLNETCQTCAVDCCCGNFVCDPGDCFSCPFDCLSNECCGDGFCDFTEDCQVCAADCGPNCCPSPSPSIPNGPSIFVFANYDGGKFTISVDANIPNVVIALVSYEAMDVSIIGPFVGNVTAVHYAGFNGMPGVTIGGVPPGIVTIDTLPPVTLADPSGNPSMVCQYQGGCGDQGGCNTSAQVQDYFINQHAGSIMSHTCQYDAYMGTLSTNVVTVCN